MSRGIAIIDRVGTAVAALALLAGGLALILWATGDLSRWVAGADGQVTTDRLAEITGETWWPWAVGLGGVLLAGAALWWLLSHLRFRHSVMLALPGSDGTGQLTLDLTSAVDAASVELAEVSGVRSARARVHHDRGQRTLDLIVMCEHDADLALLAAQAHSVCADLAGILGGSTPPARIHLHTPRRTRHSKRPR